MRIIMKWLDKIFDWFNSNEIVRNLRGEIASMRRENEYLTMNLVNQKQIVDTRDAALSEVENLINSKKLLKDSAAASIKKLKYDLNATEKALQASERTVRELMSIDRKLEKKPDGSLEGVYEGAMAGRKKKRKSKKKV